MPARIWRLMLWVGDPQVSSRCQVQDNSNWRYVGILPIALIWSVVHGDIHVYPPHSAVLGLKASKFHRRCEVLEGYSQVALQSSVSPGQPLSDGTLRGDEITFQDDSNVFNVRNGTTVPVDTSTSGLKVYRTHIDGNDILLGPRDA